MSDTPLKGQRILIAEDNAMLAITMLNLLQRAGADVVGPVTTLQDAEDCARRETLTGALLDIRLQEEEVWSAARILLSRDVPILFCSGHFDYNTLPAEWSGHAILVKSTRPATIIAKLAALVGADG